MSAHRPSRQDVQLRRSRRFLRRPGLLLAIACLLVPVAVVPADAGADEVGDLEARADRIAHELMDLRGRLSVIGEQFNQSQERRAQLQTRSAELADRARAAALQVAVRNADAANFALSAYAGIGEDDVLSMALDGRQWDLSRRTGYASISIGDRQQIVDDLQAAQRVQADLTEALAEAEQAERRLTKDLDRQQREATRLLAEQEALQDSVQGELAEAVARRQAELEAQHRVAAETGSSPAAAGAEGATNPWATDRARGAPAITGSDADPGSRHSTSAAPAPRGSSSSSSSGSSSSRPPSSRPGTTPAPTPPPTTAAPPPPPVAPPTGGGGSRAVADAAISQLGVPYSWGGGNASGPSMGFGPGAGIVGFDCSGLTLYAWARVGVSLPHSAQMQYDVSAKVSLSQLQPGDLVFYGSSSRSIDHVSVYVGGGQVVHAPNSTTVVQYGPVQLWPGYYPWIGAGRPG